MGREIRNYPAKLAESLSSVHRPGDFFVTGRVPLGPPRLEVDGIGPVALPLLPVQAEALIAAATQAPYGKGQETIFDNNIRRTWQIGPEKIHLGGQPFADMLSTILERVGEGLGVAEPFKAELYKLLVYDTGSFFAPHRDTEKSPGMFATLLISLPSHSTGGELVIRHGGREAICDMRCPEPFEVTFSALYADCVHEVLPVTQGHRLTLVYNLIRRAGVDALIPPDYATEQAALSGLLRDWRGADNADEAPLKLIYPLDHAYTPAEISFSGLKGADKAAASVLAEAAKEAECALHLALLTIEESGAAEYTGYYGRGSRNREGEEEFEPGEVFEYNTILSDWRTVGDKTPGFGALPVFDQELSPPEALDDLIPDEEHFHEATGNEGASFERTYRRAALVLWPREKTATALTQGGLDTTMPFLETLVVAGDVNEPDRELAFDLAHTMIMAWKPEYRHWWREEGVSETARFLTCLSKLADPELIMHFLTQKQPTSIFTRADCAAILAAASHLSPTDRIRAIELILSGNCETRFPARAHLLHGAVFLQEREERAALHPAAEALIAGLSGKGIDAEAISDLMVALLEINEKRAQRVVNDLLLAPKTYPFDAVLVPASRTLLAPQYKDRTPVAAFRAACLKHLHTRAALPLAPPPDWRRAHKLTCDCEYCGELSLFLADPQTEEFIVKARQDIRLHVEDTIRRSKCDLDTRTERISSPHRLVCTKNDASYRRRVKQRQSDTENIAALESV